MFLYTIDKLTFYVTSFDIKLTFHSLEMKVAFFDFSCVRMSCWMISFCFCTLKNTLTNPKPINCTQTRLIFKFLHQNQHYNFTYHMSWNYTCTEYIPLSITNFAANVDDSSALQHSSSISSFWTSLKLSLETTGHLISKAMKSAM